MTAEVQGPVPGLTGAPAAGARGGRRSGVARAAFVACIFLSSFLLFLVQPLIAKLITPWFGGSASVWTTCLVFFQVMLLAGYAYADLATRRLSPGRHAWLHMALLLAAAATLPILPGDHLRPDPHSGPAGQVVWLLALTVGLPYLCLSSTGPLLQAWYSRLWPGGQVYRLFALSNLASLGALLAYPFLLEPQAGAREQALAWSAGFGVFVLLCGGCALLSRRAPAGPVSGASAAAAAPPPSAGAQLGWLGLSALGSALLVAVTTHITQNVAAVPLLWLLPLSLYLLSFVLCFEGRGAYRRGIFVAPLLLSLAGMAWGLNTPVADTDLFLAVPAYGVAIFCGCMFLHGELALRKPAPAHLTRFYFMLSLGGAVGGMLAGVAAPAWLPGLYELDIVLLGMCVAMFATMWPYFTARRAAYPVLALAVAVTVLGAVMAWAHVLRDTQGLVVRMRNFYAPSQVIEREFNGETMRVLRNGTIMHGLQVREPGKLRQATTYYGESSGVARALQRHGGSPKRVGAIGLGVGTVAAYGGPGDVFRFYEINPQSQEIAERHFSFLADSPATIQTVLGDARLQMQAELARGEPGRFDVLVVDAFSGDAIPAHLLTVEAMDVYLAHMVPGGTIAFHVSNHFLDLQPLVQLLAARSGRQAVYLRNEERYPETASAWVLVTDDPVLLADERVRRERKPIRPIPGLQPWTDARHPLLDVLRRD